MVAALFWVCVPYIRPLVLPLRPARFISKSSLQFYFFMITYCIDDHDNIMHHVLQL